MFDITTDMPLNYIELDEKGLITSISDKAIALFSEPLQQGQSITAVIPALQIVDNEQFNCQVFDIANKKHLVFVNRIDNGFLLIIQQCNLLIIQHADIVVPILTQLSLPFFTWDISQQKVLFSASAMNVMGYQEKETVMDETIFRQHVTSEVIADFRAHAFHFSQENSQKNQMIYPFTTLSGEFIWLGVKIAFVEFAQGKVAKVVAVFTDLSESKELVSALNKKNKYIALNERVSRTGHWSIVFPEQKVEWSKGTYNIFGENPNNFQPTLDNMLAFFIDEDRDKAKQQFNKAINGKKRTYVKGTIAKKPTGEKVKLEINIETELNKDNEISELYGVVRDITAIEKIFEKLKLMSLVNYTIKMPIFFIDEKDNVVFQDLSPRAGNRSSVLFDYINFSIVQYLQFKSEAKQQGQITYKNISFDKFQSVFDISVTYEADEGIYIWIVDNITDAFNKEQQQAINNRLTLLGNTFGNVSHDINNVLGVALGAIEMLELKVAQGETDLSSYINRVKNAIDKGKDVTGRLLAFTRKPMIKLQEFDPIKDILRNEYLFEQLLLSTIEFRLNVQHVRCTITFPEGEFINILLNLFLNAQDAIKEHNLSGVIELSAEINSDKKLVITVKDSGIGIKQENIAKIFDPFYTSKSASKGNGIGLANVYSLMYKYNGEIRVDGSSDLGGAQFMLIFPCTTIDVDDSTEVSSSIALNLKGKQILILEDEITIAEFVTMYLEKEGAITNHVTNKNSLISVLNGSLTYDIFITDMILPDISGKESVAMVLEKFPNIKILSMSGYITSEDGDWNYPILRKPFNSTELYQFLSQNS
ncbi:ATP-binding protein [Thalassotalea ganghwensis]